MSVRKEMDAWRTEKERIIETIWRNIIWKNIYLWLKRKVLSGQKLWVNGHSVGCHIHIQIQIIPVFSARIKQTKLRTHFYSIAPTNNSFSVWQ